MRRVYRHPAWPQIFHVIGTVGALLFVTVFAQSPSWPTPDKLLVFMTFVSMSFGQARELLKRFVPFVSLLLVYESFRGIAHQLNSNVHYLWMPHADRSIFGVLPTAWLQHYWWHGQVQWYDFAFYIFYMLHFVFPIALALIVWKLRDHFYWQYISSYIALSFAGFATYLLYPAAPPWMASDKGLIEPITRVSSSVWYALGIHDFPSLYNKIAPNPVAAVPSLHAAYATLFVLFAYRLFGKRWAALAMIYPVMIWLGTVYQGEHYAVDAMLGIIYAVASFFAVELFFKRVMPIIRKKTWYKHANRLLIKI